MLLSKLPVPGLPTNLDYSKDKGLLHSQKVRVGTVWTFFSPIYRGWSGGAKVLGKLSVLGRPTSLDDCRARAYCACSRCGWGMFGNFFSHLFFLFSFSLSLGDGLI